MKKGILLVLVLAALLTGCDSQDYEQAMALYEAGDYGAASAIFVRLEDYENSATMVTACAYGQAMDAYGQGRYDQARAAFAALDGYENSTQMVTACDYALAVAVYEAGDYGAAWEAFQALEDYEDAEDLAEEARWRSIGQYIRAKGQTREAGVSAIGVGAGDVTVYLGVCEDAPERLVLWGEKTQDLGFYSERHVCELVYTREAAEAEYQLLTRTDTFADGMTGYTETAAGGQVALDALTADTLLERSAFSYYARDVYGNEYEKDVPTVTDLVEAQGLLAAVLEQAPALLELTGTGYTLRELGFALAPLR